MKIRWRRAVGLVMATGLLAAVPAIAHTTPAAATTRPYQVNVYESTSSVPHTVRSGSSFTAHTWYEQTSKYQFATTMFQLQLSSPTSSTPRGVSVTWLDPLTGQWEPATYQSGTHRYTLLTLGNNLQILKLPPNQWAKIYYRVNFAKTATKGTWHMQVLAPDGGGPIDSHNNPITSPIVVWFQWKTYAFAVD